MRASPATAVAALYDVHGNSAALDAVLAEVGDAILVFGGDMAAGPVPAETLDRIIGLVEPSNTVLQARANAPPPRREPDRAPPRIQVTLCYKAFRA